jgi:16S rRNA (cytidine1402-2'-O)-methyltransferase
VGRLYLIGLPAAGGTGGDVTLRALRILGEGPALAAVDAAAAADARQFLTGHGLRQPVIVADPDAILAALAVGDVALLWRAESQLVPPEPLLASIRAVLEAGAAVVPIPGPSLPLAALVVSGLPADSFVFLGPFVALELPLSALAGERRTLVGLETAARLEGTLAGLLAALGDRPVALAAVPASWPDGIWRGTLQAAVQQGTPALAASAVATEEWVLVLGGAQEAVPVWEQARLTTDITTRLANGQGAREIAQQLAAESGWPRREIYRLATRSRRHS